MFVFNPLTSGENPEPKSPSKLAGIFESIKEVAEGLKQGPGVGALTCDFRDKWALNRYYTKSTTLINP